MQHMKHFGEGKRQLVLCYKFVLCVLVKIITVKSTVFFPQTVALLQLLGKASFVLNERIRFINYGMNNTEVILDKCTCN